MRCWCFDEPIFPRRIRFKCTKKEKDKSTPRNLDDQTLGFEQEINCQSLSFH